MVGFISEPAIEDDDHSRAPKAKDSNGSSAVIDQKASDISLADTFLDFDSIKAWFEHFPDDSGSGQQPGELFMAEVEEAKALIDGVCVKSELTSVGGTEEGGSALGDVDGFQVDDSASLMKSERVSGAENEKSSDIASLDCLKMSEDMLNGGKGGEVSDGDSESESSSESEDTSSSSSSSSSSSDDDEDDNSDDDGEEDEHIKEIKVAADDAGEMEEGEIREGNLEKMSIRSCDDDDDDGDKNVDDTVIWSDIEDNDATGGSGGPVRSKNELKVLPSVPRVEAKLEPNHQMLPVGVVLSVLGAQVIVEGVEKHHPLNEGSILWIIETRTPLGLVDEIFGPVKNPYYVVRYNSEDEVPSAISQGTQVSCVPEFSSYILNEKNLYKKGYDASGDNDEELSDEAEFSDDEKEAEYRRMQRMAKRGPTDPSDQKGVSKKNYGKKNRGREGRWKKNSDNRNPSSLQLPPNLNPQNQNSPDLVSSSSVPRGLTGQTGLISPFFPPPQPGSSVPLTSSGVWMNGNFPSQQQIGAALANGFPNGMQWAAQGNQFPYQTPMQNPLLIPNLVLPNIGQSTALGGLPFTPWPSSVVHNASNSQTFGMEFHQIPSFNGGPQGVRSNGLQIDTSAASPGISEAPGIFNPGTMFGQGEKPPLNRRGGGRFSGNRGRFSGNRGRFSGNRGRQQFN